MTKTHVVVADSSGARSFVSDEEHALVSLAEIFSPDGRQHVRHGHVPHTDVHDAETERLAARIAGFFDKARCDGGGHDAAATAVVYRPRR